MDLRKLSKIADSALNFEKVDDLLSRFSAEELREIISEDQLEQFKEFDVIGHFEEMLKNSTKETFRIYSLDDRDVIFGKGLSQFEAFLNFKYQECKDEDEWDMTAEEAVERYKEFCEGWENMSESVYWSLIEETSLTGDLEEFEVGNAREVVSKCEYMPWREVLYLRSKGYVLNEFIWENAERSEEIENILHQLGVLYVHELTEDAEKFTEDFRPPASTSWLI